MATYKIHPGIGIARLGNSDTEFYIAPETPAGLPQACEPNGNPRYQANGVTPMLVTTFRDAQGRIKRQAARFQVFVYDDDSPAGRPLKLGDPIEGGGNHGTLVEIQWQVYVANKKPCWYEFLATDGEHGYPPNHPRRNPDVKQRDRLIIDPGPRNVTAAKRRAFFDRSGEGNYATTFPSEGLTPNGIDTLGEMMMDDAGRLLVLGGHGCSGSEKSGPGEPHVTQYANNDGWYDDISDGPVMARLVMFSQEVQRKRYIDVEYPAWVIVGYPRYVPQMLDMVTMDELLHDLFLQQFATDTSLYGRLGSFANPDRIDFHNDAQLRQWRDGGRLTWNTDYKPLFYRDIWPILYRPDQFRFVCDILAQSNYPHDQEQRGLFDPSKLSIVPGSAKAQEIESAQDDGQESAKRQIEYANLSRLTPVRPGAETEPPADPYGPLRRFLFGLLRLPGEENEFRIEDQISSRLHNLPLMPLLCGDNPLSNTAPSKFLRLTDYMLFILKQWAEGRFINEMDEGWLQNQNPPYTPYLPYPTAAPKTGRGLDAGVMSNVLGGAFCPGGETTWIMRNPSIYWEPYRLKADRSISDFLLSAAQVNSGLGVDADYTFNVQNPLSQNSDFVTGLQPGDITKYSGLPWQTDFNECTFNNIDITYADWNVNYPDSENDEDMRNDTKVWTTIWWPAHRPLQYWEVTSVANGNPTYLWTNWSKGVPQTHAGDLKMVTEWAKLGFIIRNPYLPDSVYSSAATGSDNIYVSVETRLSDQS